MEAKNERWCARECMSKVLSTQLRVDMQSTYIVYRYDPLSVIYPNPINADYPSNKCPCMVATIEIC